MCECDTPITRFSARAGTHKNTANNIQYLCTSGTQIISQLSAHCMCSAIPDHPFWPKTFITDDKVNHID